MARTIQSPGVEVKEVDLSLRPQLPIGTTVFIPGFSNQGPTDELLTVSSLSEFEQIYGLPTNAAERYMYHSVKAVFQSPANVLVTRLPYGTGAGSTVADRYSVQVYPVIPRPVIYDSGTHDFASDADDKIYSIAVDERQIAWQLTGTVGTPVPLEDIVVSDVPPGADYTGITLAQAISNALSGSNEDIVYELKSGSASLSALAEEGTLLSEAGEELYRLPEVSEFISRAVNTVGWDLSASDRYYLGEPSNIELTADEYQKTVKGQIKLSGKNAGRSDNQKFSTYDDLLTKGGAGMMIVNNKKFVINEKFEGYYLGISDNTNLNPASDFDSVGKLKSLSKALGGTSGGYVDVPDESAGTLSRLTFSLSAGFTFDSDGNKQQIGLDGSISEV